MHLAALEREWFQTAPQLSEETGRCLRRLLGLLRAMHWNYWTSHWVTQGVAFYGDHLLFQRFYEAMPAEIDGLAEKVVAYFGDGHVNALDQMALAHRFLGRWGSNDVFGSGLNSEKDLQNHIKHTMLKMEEAGESVPGLEDFLPALANTHETNIYLLQQRLRGSVKKKP